MVFPSCNDLVLPGLLAIDHHNAAVTFPPKPSAGIVCDPFYDNIIDLC